MRKRRSGSLYALYCIVFVSLYFWDNGDDGKFVRWGDSVHSVDTEVLKEIILNTKLKMIKCIFQKNHWIKQYIVARNK